MPSTLGKFEYYDVRNELYSQTQAVMLVYDVTNRASFQSMEAWNRECVRCASSFPLATVVVANKVSLLLLMSDAGISS